MVQLHIFPQSSSSHNYQRNELFSSWKQVIKFSYFAKIRLLCRCVCFYHLCYQLENLLCIGEEISLSVCHINKEYAGHSDPWEAAYGKSQSFIGLVCT